MTDSIKNRLTDSSGRVHDYLRISVTDKCNFNCLYCSPASNQKLNKSDILSYDELLRLAGIFVRYAGVRKIRITGGEPLARKNILYFFEGLAALQKKLNFEIAVTTNGSMLAKYVTALKEYGVSKINISLDSVNADTFSRITGKAELPVLLKNISLAENSGFELKLNAVIIRNVNSMEIPDFIHFVKDRNMTLRFIEYMPFIKNQWHQDKFVSAEEIRQSILRQFSLVKAQNYSDRVADVYQLEGYKGKIGFITPISNHFCQSCSRLRIKADGKMKLCLFSNPESEIDLKTILRSHIYTDQMIADYISEKLQFKPVKRPELNELADNKNNMMNIGG